MRLIEYIKRTNALDSKILARENSEKLLNFLEAGIPLSELATNNKDLLKSIPGAQLRRLIDTRRSWQSIEEARERIVSIITEKSGVVPPDSLFDSALSSRRMEALEHILPLFPRDQFESVLQWSEAIEVALGVWTGALNLSMKKGVISVDAKERASYPVKYEEIFGNEPLSEMSNEKWAMISEGLEQGKLTISFEFPVSSIASHLDGVFDSLGTYAASLGNDEMLEQLVLLRLPEAITMTFNRKVLDERLKNLGNIYLDILKTPPIKVPKLGSFCPSESGDVAGMVVINDKGKVLASQSLD
ncbi:hypothetical protein KKF84_00820, partial [Myxococcota bacterium]|nr:hypothetical protein [Myxococcota bacterium]